MIGRRVASLGSAATLAGLVACGGGDDAGSEGVAADTLPIPGYTAVEMSAVRPETSVVVTDTDSSRDAVGGEAPNDAASDE